MATGGDLERWRLARILVPVGAPIRAAMVAIGAGAVDLALVEDEAGRLVGTVTDGDVRRALLDGASLDDPIARCVNKEFTAVSPQTDRAWVLDLMRARTLNGIPVVDDGMRAVGLHVLREMITSAPRDERAVILAGGLGARLRPLTNSIPKPMIQVAGRPILERLVLHLVGSGIRHILLAVNHFAAVIEDHFGDGSRFGCTISYLKEAPECPLGTAGALCLVPAADRQSGPLLVMNGDLITEFDVGRLLERHRSARNVLTVAAHEYVHDVPFGVLQVRDDRVIALEEKPKMAWPVSAGIYVVDPKLIDFIPPAVTYPMTELVATAIAGGARVGTCRIDGEWIDIGRSADLRSARGEE